METATAKEQLITIAGRQFHGVSQELSAAQDDYLIGQLRKAGALELVLSADPQKAEQTAEALLTQIMISGKSPEVLAGVLTEVGKKWTFEDAQKNAQVFAEVTDIDSKREMRTATVGFVVGFFQFATAYATTFRKSSLPN
jgi:hypothetical protein